MNIAQGVRIMGPSTEISTFPSSPSSPPAGWFDDPEWPGQKRYWDGTRWTDRRVPAPPVAPPATPRPPAQPVAGWYDDPYSTGRRRYWDGAQWTGETLPPPIPAPSPAPPPPTPAPAAVAPPPPATPAPVEATTPPSPSPEPPVITPEPEPEPVAVTPPPPPPEPEPVAVTPPPPEPEPEPEPEPSEAAAARSTPPEPRALTPDAPPVAEPEPEPEPTERRARGWYDDPRAPGQERFWTGTVWSEDVRLPTLDLHSPSALAGAREGTPPIIDLTPPWYRRRIVWAIAAVAVLAVIVVVALRGCGASGASPEPGRFSGTGDGDFTIDFTVTADGDVTDLEFNASSDLLDMRGTIGETIEVEDGAFELTLSDGLGLQSLTIEGRFTDGGRAATGSYDLGLAAGVEQQSGPEADASGSWQAELTGED